MLSRDDMQRYVLTKDSNAQTTKHWERNEY